jgi:lipid II:glycine glycyltransferase (peptidoglycan interpeptide bridge formation enzyme)
VSDRAVEPLPADMPPRRSSLLLSIEDAAEHAEWDAFVTRTFGGDIAQTSAWGRIKRSAGMDVYRIVVRADGQIAGGAQLLVRPLPVAALGRVAYAPYGPLLAPEGVDDATPLLIQGLRQLCRQRSIAALVVQPPQGGEQIGTALRSAGFRPTGVDVAPSASMRVDLRLSNDELLERMNRHTRREFRQSLRGPVTVRFASGSDLASFHQLYCVTANRHGFTPWSARYLQTVWHELRPKGQVELLLAEVDGVDVAGNLVTCFGEAVTGRLVGFDPDRLKGRIRPNELLMWRTMEWARDIGVRWLDVGGVPRADAIALVYGGEPEGEQNTLKMRLSGIPLVYPEPLELIPNSMLRAGYRVLGSRKVVHALRSSVQQRLRTSSHENSRSSR